MWTTYYYDDLMKDVAYPSIGGGYFFLLHFVMASIIMGAKPIDRLWFVIIYSVVTIYYSQADFNAYFNFYSLLDGFVWLFISCLFGIGLGIRRFKYERMLERIQQMKQRRQSNS